MQFNETVNGWSELTHDVWSKMFWDIKKEHWLESDYQDNVGGDRFFVYYTNAAPMVFAVSSSDEMFGEVYNSEGSECRYLINEIRLVEDNFFAQIYFFWEQVQEGDFSSAVHAITTEIKPFYNEHYEAYRAQCIAEDA